MKSKLTYLLSAILFVACLCSAEDSFGQKKKPAWSPPRKPGVGGVRGLAPVPTTDELTPEPELTRGSLCCMQFENKTGFFIDIWFDNKYQGRISPWQTTFSLCSNEGFKTFYAQTTGKTLDWAGNFECEGYIGFVPK